MQQHSLGIWPLWQLLHARVCWDHEAPNTRRTPRMERPLVLPGPPKPPWAVYFPQKFARNMKFSHSLHNMGHESGYFFSWRGVTPWKATCRRAQRRSHRGLHVVGKFSEERIQIDELALQRHRLHSHPFPALASTLCVCQARESLRTLVCTSSCLKTTVNHVVTKKIAMQKMVREWMGGRTWSAWLCAWTHWLYVLLLLGEAEAARPRHPPSTAFQAIFMWVWNSGREHDSWNTQSNMKRRMPLTSSQTCKNVCIFPEHKSGQPFVLAWNANSHVNFAGMPAAECRNCVEKMHARFVPATRLCIPPPCQLSFPLTEPSDRTQTQTQKSTP
jgi:hypothetical protein